MEEVDAFQKWREGATKRTLSVPGVVEFRAYRTAAGTSQVVSTWEFADMTAWAAWFSSEEVQKVIAELYTLTLNASVELWGPSPLVHAPIRPGK
jgi:heme-degrading monooxygenase HmoA